MVEQVAPYYLCTNLCLFCSFLYLSDDNLKLSETMNIFNTAVYKRVHYWSRDQWCSKLCLTDTKRWHGRFTIQYQEHGRCLVRKTIILCTHTINRRSRLINRAHGIINRKSRLINHAHSLLISSWFAFIAMLHLNVIYSVWMGWPLYSFLVILEMFR